MNTIILESLQNATATFYNEVSGEWEAVDLEKVRDMVKAGVSCIIEGELEYGVIEDNEEDTWSIKVGFEVNDGQLHFKEERLYEQLDVEYSEEVSNNNYLGVAELFEEVY